MSHTLNDTTVASTPGEMQITKKKYLDYVGLTGLTRHTYSFILSLPIGFLYKNFGADKYVFDYIRKGEQFKSGCLNPTTVLNMDQGLIATFTDLSNNGVDTVPVIKISKEPLHLIKNVTVTNGQRLPTVALYSRDPQHPLAPAWIDFSPKIANCFTNDVTVCNTLLAKVTGNAWKCLQLGLEQIEDKSKEGLYYVKIQKELVENAW